MGIRAELATKHLLLRFEWRRARMFGAIREEKHKDALEHAAELAALLRQLQEKQRSKLRRKS